METQPAKPSDDVLSKPKGSFWMRLGGGSLTISIIIHAILVAIGVVWIFQIIPPPPEKKVDFASSGGGGSPKNSNQQKKQKNIVRNNASRVAAKDVASDFSLPDPVASSDMSALGALGAGGMGGMGGMGGGKGLGNGSGNGNGLGAGLGGAGAAVSFFNLETKATRIAYVIDFSMSMKGEREELMRRELTKSVKSLPATAQYGLIFFSGPVWLPGDEVANNVVKSGGKSYKWDSITSWEWKTRDPFMKVPWKEANANQVKKDVSLIRDTALIGGTDWEAPLEIAMSMEPPPQMIFFMTDGAMEQRDMLRLTRGLAAKAKTKGIVINTVALMEPAAEEAMGDLAKRTGGQFTVVESGGKVRNMTRK